jgi:hypothetical protein
VSKALCQICGEWWDTETTALHMCQKWHPSNTFKVCRKCGVLYDPIVPHSCAYTVTFSGSTVNTEQIIMDKLDKILKLLIDLEYEVRGRTDV